MTEPTKLLYLDDSSVDTMTATVVECESDERGTHVITDQTVFYPQGGGQPGDTGVFQVNGSSVRVLSTRFSEGRVLHYVESEIPAGTEITGTIERSGRDINSRAHSAGHLLDVVVDRLFPDWLPDRGHHFPGECFVSYEGAKPQNVESFITEANLALSELITANLPITDSLTSIAEIREKCTYVPPNMPEDKPLRVVTIGDHTPCPCGGTHIPELADLGSVTITKVKSKKGKVKVSYTLSASLSVSIQDC